MKYALLAKHKREPLILNTMKILEKKRMNKLMKEIDELEIEEKDAQIAQLEVDKEYAVGKYHMAAAMHETEKTMRQFAEEDLSKFKKIFGRLYWNRGIDHGRDTGWRT